MALGLKICGVWHPDDAVMCRQAGVPAVGLNFWSGSKRRIDLVQAKRIAGPLRGHTDVVGVFVDHSPGEVAGIAAEVGLDAIQPHGDADPAPYAALGLPWVWVVRTPVDLSTLRVPLPAPRWVLLDAPTAGFGGQGVVADWTSAAAVVAALSPLPVWLAGGIAPSNASAAIASVAPAGLDVASGAELVGTTPPRKDAAAIAALLAACRG